MTIENFKTFYPQFSNMPAEVLNEYFRLAQLICDPERWLEMTDEGVRLYTAHKCTLYLRTKAPDNAPNAMVAAMGEAKGIKTNKAVGGVSVGMSESSATTGITGWGDFKTTEYGIQFMTMARQVGIGGMYVP